MVEDMEDVKGRRRGEEVEMAGEDGEAEKMEGEEVGSAEKI